MSCLWSVLHHAAAAPGAPLSLNQALRMLSQQGAAAKLVSWRGCLHACSPFGTFHGHSETYMSSRGLCKQPRALPSV